MSVAAVTNLAGKASSASDFAKTSKPDAETGFGAMIAGASKSSVGTAAPPRVTRPGDKTHHARRTDESTRADEDKTALADAAVTATAPLAASAPMPSDATAADTRKTVSDTAPRVVASSASAPAPTTDPAIDLTQSIVDTTDAKLAPVLAALADSLAVKRGGDRLAAPVVTDPTPAAEATVVSATIPTTATAALMASRITPAGTPFSGRADARVPVASRKASDGSDTDTDPAAATLDPAAAVTVSAIPVPTTAAVATDARAPIADNAAGQLATGGADRQLDLARQGAWLDGIAHDIATTGAGTGPLRFAVAPQHLGAVQVEMTRDAVGATVTLTASSEASRVALADARPQLIAEAGRHGIHIANAQVDVGSGQAGSDSRQSSAGQTDSRPSTSGTSSFSAQANAQGDSGRQSQTRSQPSAANPVSKPGAPDAEPAPEPTDGLYA